MAEGRYHAFDDPVHDQLLGIVLALGAEVWSLRDRLALLEMCRQRLGQRVGQRLRAGPAAVGVGQHDESARRHDRQRRERLLETRIRR